MRIGKIDLSEEKIVGLIEQIKRKKELREVSDAFVRDQLFQYFLRSPGMVSVLENPRSTQYKKIIKEMRAVLRRVYGLFRVEQGATERRELVEKLVKQSLDEQLVYLRRILSTHSSTRERLAHYEELYAKIWKITGKPAKIIDLGCGINPFSIYLMDLPKLQYYAYDISEEEISLLGQFFKQEHRLNPSFKGVAEILDALHFAALEKLHQVDVCFLFKMTDVLDRGKGHKVTEEVLRRVPARFVVVSFATKTMSGKKMTAPRRRWMEWLCQRLGWKYTLVEIPNELFYVVEKK